MKTILVDPESDMKSTDKMKRLGIQYVLNAYGDLIDNWEVISIPAAERWHKNTKDVHSHSLTGQSRQKTVYLLQQWRFSFILRAKNEHSWNEGKDPTKTFSFFTHFLRMSLLLSVVPFKILARVLWKGVDTPHHFIWPLTPMLQVWVSWHICEKTFNVWICLHVWEAMSDIWCVSEWP